MMKTMTQWVLSAAALGAACGDAGSTLYGDQAATGAGASMASGTATSASGLGVGGGLGTSGSGGDQTTGCDKVDFLFIVDNSISMKDQQAALIASFPGFLTTIKATLSATSDYHIMVADTDAWGRCNTKNPWTGINPTSSTCNDYVKNTVFTECDRTLGAGVVNPAGQAASNKLCPIFGGNRYIVQGEPDLNGTFGCIASVGLAGHSQERPMDALVAAMDKAINATGGCNAGFVRDDAILVITFISDDTAYVDKGTPNDWYQAVLTAKKGNKDAVVVLGITPNFPGCSPGKGTHWSELVKLWGSHGLEASVCSKDYAPFFKQAIAVIDDTCDNFVKPN